MAQRQANAATAASTPYHFQIVDVGHGPNDVIYDSAFPTASPNATNTPYIVGQAINFAVRSVTGPDPKSVSWTNYDPYDSPGYFSYNYPPLGSSATSGSIAIATATPMVKSSTPLPYVIYALNANSAAATAQIKTPQGGIATAFASVPVVFPSVQALPTAYAFTVANDATNGQDLAMVGPAANIPGVQTNLSVVSTDTATKGVVSINQVLSYACFTFATSSQQITLSGSSSVAPYFDTQVSYPYSGIAAPPPTYFQPPLEPNLTVATSPPMHGQTILGQPLNVAQMDFPQLDNLSAAVAAIKKTFPTSAPVIEIAAS